MYQILYVVVVCLVGRRWLSVYYSRGADMLIFVRYLLDSLELGYNIFGHHTIDLLLWA